MEGLGSGTYALRASQDGRALNHTPFRVQRDI